KQFDWAVLSLLNSLMLFDFLQSAQIETVMVLLTQIVFEVGIEAYVELIEKHLATIQSVLGEEVVLKLRKHLFEE
ncbi:MAG: hypothetical protein F6K30_30300, partial [Cyanothece sp. SIO2G6]|nr:hypothetical protein [Cyanothece sp. SIO2G6]